MYINLRSIANIIRYTEESVKNIRCRVVSCIYEPESLTRDTTLRDVADEVRDTATSASREDDGLFESRSFVHDLLVYNVSVR